MNTSRAYINPKYDQMVDDGCLEYQSVPMAVVNKVLKVEHATNDFTGIKQVYNKIPPRPKDILTMATSIARINNMPYNLAVPDIAKKIIDEEVKDVRSFVEHEPMDSDYGSGSESDVESGSNLPPQHYIAEQPVKSSSGVRLQPSQHSPFPNLRRTISEGVSMILGNIPASSGVVPLTTNTASQTEFVNRSMETQTNIPVFIDTQTNYLTPPISMGILKDDVFSMANKSESGKSRNGKTYREGMGTQTHLSKPLQLEVKEVGGGLKNKNVKITPDTPYQYRTKMASVNMESAPPNQFRTNVAYPTQSSATDIRINEIFRGIKITPDNRTKMESAPPNQFRTNVAYPTQSRATDIRINEIFSRVSQ